DAEGGEGPAGGPDAEPEDAGAGAGGRGDVSAADQREQRAWDRVEPLRADRAGRGCGRVPVQPAGGGVQAGRDEGRGGGSAGAVKKLSQRRGGAEKKSRFSKGAGYEREVDPGGRGGGWAGRVRGGERRARTRA